MTVKVTDQRRRAGLSIGDGVAIELGSITSPTPYKLQLFGLTTGTVITFPYNPEGFQKSVRPVWADRNLPGRTKPIWDWKRKDAETVSIRYLLQLDDPTEASTFQRALENAAKAIVEQTGEPELWQLVAGVGFDFIGHISNVTTDWVRTVETGEIDAADIQFEMTENAKP